VTNNKTSKINKKRKIETKLVLSNEREKESPERDTAEGVEIAGERSDGKLLVSFYSMFCLLFLIVSMKGFDSVMMMAMCGVKIWL
jgi:hypothetical protein